MNCPDCGAETHYGIKHYCYHKPAAHDTALLEAAEFMMIRNNQVIHDDTFQWQCTHCGGFGTNPENIQHVNCSWQRHAATIRARREAGEERNATRVCQAVEGIENAMKARLREQYGSTKGDEYSLFEVICDCASIRFHKGKEVALLELAKDVHSHDAALKEAAYQQGLAVTRGDIAQMRDEQEAHDAAIRDEATLQCLLDRMGNWNLLAKVQAVDGEWEVKVVADRVSVEAKLTKLKESANGR